MLVTAGSLSTGVAAPGMFQFGRSGSMVGTGDDCARLVPTQVFLSIYTAPGFFIAPELVDLP